MQDFKDLIIELDSHLAVLFFQLVRALAVSVCAVSILLTWIPLGGTTSQLDVCGSAIPILLLELAAFNQIHVVAFMCRACSAPGLAS